MVFVRAAGEGHTEDCQHGVADVFVEDALVIEDDVDGKCEVLVEQGHCFGGANAF